MAEHPIAAVFIAADFSDKGWKMMQAAASSVSEEDEQVEKKRWM